MMNTRTSKPFGLLALLGATLLAVGATSSAPTPDWSSDELEVLRSLWLGSREPLAPDPSNRFADDTAAARLGHRLFFDSLLSADNTVSCATCHRPELQFQDGLPLARGVGRTDRRTMTVVGTAGSPWLFWDGRKDSQWAQALGPLESPVEHGTDRTSVVRHVADRYRGEYEAVFGTLPDPGRLPPKAGPVTDPGARAAWEVMDPGDRDAVNRAYANVGKALAAYQRSLQHGPSRFDRYVERLLEGDAAGAAGILDEEEEAGLRLFIGKGQCVNCHNGPLFTDDFFHNTGVPAVRGLPEDRGRATGALQVRQDEFNCLGPYSDATPRDCAELRYMVAEGEELVRAFRTPSLRGVAERAPYMHAGQLASLSEVLAHYDRSPKAPAGRSELRALRLRLSATERARIEAFLATLSAPVDAPAEFLQAPYAGGGEGR